MNALVMAFAFNLGIRPVDQFLMYDPPPVVCGEVEAFAQFDVQLVAFGFLYAGGSARVYAWPYLPTISLWPSRAEMVVEAGMRCGGAELYFRHYCTHPIIPFGGSWQINDGVEGAYEEVGIRFTGKAVIFE